MKTQNTTNRTAYSLQEMAQLFGKHRSWAYRMVREKRIKTITGFGAQLVPAHEIDRILSGTSQPSADES